jgi:acyl carrier protein
VSYAMIRAVVVEWLDDQYHFGDAEKLIGGNDELSFLDRAILDSLGFVKLVVHLEDLYRIKIDRKNLTRVNFDGMKKIVTYVLSHKDYRGPR